MNVPIAFRQVIMTDKRYYSPIAVSQALGVGVSTIKRWVDAGVLRAQKTAGGHRKILLQDVLRLVREHNFPLLNLARLSLPDVLEELDAEQLSQHLFDYLCRGEIAHVRFLIHGAYSAGIAIDVLGDDVITPAMVRLGHEWENGSIDVMHEHRATVMCMSVLHELLPRLEANAAIDRPVAAGGNPEGDHGMLASLLVQLLLIDAGWDAINLGPNTPIPSFSRALKELKPRLMWLSISHLSESESFLQQYHSLYRDAARAGVALAVGGQALSEDLIAQMPNTFSGNSLKQLAAFACTLHHRPQPRTRGRPKKQT